MRPFSTFVLASGLLALLTLAGHAQQPNPRKGNAAPDSLKARPGNLKVGDAAPGFALKNVQGKMETRLADLQGKPVVLFFGSCT